MQNYETLLFILFAAQAAAVEETNQATKDYFLNEIIDKTKVLLENSNGQTL